MFPPRPSLEVLFWVSALLLTFTFAGYPLLMRVLARISPRFFTPPVATTPSVTVIVIAYNEAARIADRVHNLLASVYPAEKMHIIIVSDGSTDATSEIVQAIGHPSVSCIALPVRGGKPAGLNVGIAAATGEIIVFTDARQSFAPETIARLAAHFSDPTVGAVSGELHITPASGGTGAGFDLYWQMERRLRADEAQWDSCIGCTGAVYAARRALLETLPPDTILDDVLIPMRIAARGSRILHDPAATAHDPQPLEPLAEKRRKRRTIAGNFQLLFRYPAWLTPAGHRLWWQIIAHKYLRLTAPLFLALCLFSAGWLQKSHLFYRLAFIAQLTLYVLATFAMLLPRQNPLAKHKLFTIPSAFVFLNLATVSGLWHYLTTRDPARWKTRP